MKKEVTFNEEEIRRICMHLEAAERHYDMLKSFIARGQLSTAAGPMLTKNEADVKELLTWLKAE